MFGKIRLEFQGFDREGQNSNVLTEKVRIVEVSLFFKIHLILSVSVFSNNSSMFTIHASQLGSPLFTFTL